MYPGLDVKSLSGYVPSINFVLDVGFCLSY
jgi:hypothetical protein